MPLASRSLQSPATLIRYRRNASMGLVIADILRL